MPRFVASEENPFVVREPLHAVEVHSVDLCELRFSGTSRKQHQPGALKLMMYARDPFAVWREGGPVPVSKLHGGRTVGLSQVDGRIAPLAVGELNENQRLSVV